MNVLLNAASANMGGTVTYLRDLLRWLPRVAPDVGVTAVLPAHTRAKLEPDVANGSVRLLDFPYAATGGLARMYFDQVQIPRLALRHRADVLYSSTGYGTFRSPRPQALLVRNTLAFVDEPRMRAGAPRRERIELSLRRRWAVRSMRTADRVLFPSAAMRDLVAPHARLPADRVEVIHYGLDVERFLQCGGEPPPIAERMRSWRAEGCHLLLNVSLYARHKNLETVLGALVRLRERGIRVRFVTTVPAGDAEDSSPDFQRFLARIRELELDSTVVRTGSIGHHQLAHLYRAADLFVFPSSTESFGHPLVEAMACGLPTVASDIPVTREICGDAGVYFPTFDPTACADRIEQLIRDIAERRRLASNARARAGVFSWRTHAERLAHSLAELAGSRPAGTRRVRPGPGTRRSGVAAW